MSLKNFYNKKSKEINSNKCHNKINLIIINNNSNNNNSLNIQMNSKNLISLRISNIISLNNSINSSNNNN